MGIYSTFNYDDRVGFGTKYGDSPRFAYSVLPFVATATDYSEVSLSWAQPQGEYTKIRLVRSQDGYPETEEDGVILWSWFGVTNEYGEVDPEAGYAERITSFVDNSPSEALKLRQGAFSYYRIWLYTTTDEWVSAGDAYTLVTSSHSYVTPKGEYEVTTHEKFMDLLPRVFTTATQSPIDEVDPNSVLYSFLSGLTFGLDEIMTYADSILPENTGRYLSPELVNLASYSLGLQIDSFSASKNQKRLIREAYYIYSRKGTRNALETYVESLTGWAPRISVSPNVLLSPQDSSFYKGVGNWLPIGDCTLTVAQDIEAVNNSVEPYATDLYYMGKVVAGTGDCAIENGRINPVVNGAQVTAGTTYKLSAKVRTASGTGNVWPIIYWYDRKGVEIGSSASFHESVTTSWETVSSLNFTAPGGEFPVVSYSITSNVATLELGVLHGLSTSEEVQITDSNPALNGTFTITARTETSISFDLTAPDAATVAGTGVVKSATNTAKAEFASIKFEFLTNGTYYVDMVQLAEYTVDEYHEAKGVEIFLNPKKTNLVKNPSFNPSNSAAWYLKPDVIGGPVTTTATYVTPSTLEESVNGTHMLKVVTVSGEEVNLFTDIGVVNTGVFYCFSIHLATNTVGVVDTGVSLAVDLYNADLLPASPTDAEWEAALVSSTVQNVDEVTNAWNKYFVRAFVESTTPNVVARVRVNFSGTGNEILMDDAQMEIGYNPTDHFDGDIPASFGAVWEGGTANASNARSHIYPNKGIKITRLTENVRDFLPFDTPYVIETYAGVETRSDAY